MAQIVPTTEQAAAIAHVKGRVPVCSDGKVIGLFAPYTLEAAPFTAAEIAEAERCLDDPNMKWFTTKEVLAHLRSLEDR